MILEVPDGDKCKGCIFLRIMFLPDIAKCVLFKCDLKSKYKYGEMDIETIEKCSDCPGNKN